MKVINCFPRVVLFRLFHKADVVCAAPYDEERLQPGSQTSCLVPGFGIQIDAWDGTTVIFTPRLQAPVVVHDEDTVTIAANGNVFITSPSVIAQTSTP